MSRPATRFREGLERIEAGWRKANAAVQEEESGGDEVPDCVFDELDAAEGDIGVCSDEDTVARLLEALDDEYQRGREDMAREAVAQATSIGERLAATDPVVSGVVDKVVAEIITLLGKGLTR